MKSVPVRINPLQYELLQIDAEALGISTTKYINDILEARYTPSTKEPKFKVGDLIDARHGIWIDLFQTQDFGGDGKYCEKHNLSCVAVYWSRSNKPVYQILSFGDPLTT